MKKYFFSAILIIALGLVNCTKPETTDALGEQNKAVVDKYIQAVITGDQKTVSELLAEDFKGYGPYHSDSTNKTQEIENFIINWRERFGSMKYKRITSLSTSAKEGNVKGDWVMEWGTLTVTYKNGRLPVTISIHTVSRLKDGKINLIANYWNSGDIMRQQGFKFIPPEEQQQPEAK